MKQVKRTIIILVIIGVAGLGVFRAAQVISAKKDEKRADQRQTPLVEVAPVSQGLVEEKISRVGDIVPFYQVTIYSKVQGWVEKVNVREGDRVKAGDVLVTMDAREADAGVAQALANLEASQARLKQVKATSEETIQAQIQQTKANLDFADADYKRLQELFQKNFISRQQLDDSRTKYNVAKSTYDLALNSLSKKTWENDIALADAQVRQAKASLDLAQAQLANLRIVSPMDGGVIKRYVDPGTMVKDTTPILNLIDLGQVKMVLNVIEREFILLRKGQSVQITTTAFPGRTFQGQIAVITPALDPQSRTAEIQIAIPNPGYVLNPGMFGRAEILLRSTPNALLVPIQAVANDDEKDFVYIYKDGKAIRRPIQKGLTQDTVVEVAKGLLAGEQVIVSGAGTLKDGMPVQLAAKSRKG